MPEAPSIVPERPNRGESMTKSAVRHRARRKGLVLRKRGHAYYLTDEKGAVVAGGPWSSLKDIAAVQVDPPWLWMRTPYAVFFTDDFPSISVGALRISRDSTDSGTVEMSDGNRCWYSWNTLSPSPFVTLKAGGKTKTFRLTYGASNFGERVYFLGDDDARAMKVFLTSFGWCTKREANLQNRSCYMSKKNRMRQSRERWAKKLLEYQQMHPTTVGRKAKLETRLDSLTYRLAHWEQEKYRPKKKRQKEYA